MKFFRAYIGGHISVINFNSCSILKVAVGVIITLCCLLINGLGWFFESLGVPNGCNSPFKAELRCV